MTNQQAILIDALLTTGHREPELRRMLQRAFGAQFVARLPQGDDGLRGLARRARAQLDREGWITDATLYDAVRAGGLVTEAQVREVAEPLGVVLSETQLEGGDIAGPLCGRYRRFEAVDDGPSSVVYRGSDRRLRILDVRAIKVLKPAVACDRKVVQAFLDDCANMLLIGHPRVVRALTVDEDRGLPFLVLDFLEGGNLRQRLGGGQPLPEDEAARITLQLLEGLEEIHHARVLHRRLNPNNVLFDADGSVQVGDFTSPRIERSPVPLDELPASTRGYLAPELRTPVAPPDRRADLYSVGVLLAAMLLGEEQGRDLSNEEEWDTAMAWLPVRLAPVIRSATARIPEDRYPDAASMRADLLTVLNGGARTGYIGGSDELVPLVEPAEPSIARAAVSESGATAVILPTQAIPAAAEIAPAAMGRATPGPSLAPTRPTLAEPAGPSWTQFAVAAGAAFLVAALALAVLARVAGVGPFGPESTAVAAAGPAAGQGSAALAPGGATDVGAQSGAQPGGVPPQGSAAGGAEPTAAGSVVASPPALDASPGSGISVADASFPGTASDPGPQAGSRSPVPDVGPGHSSPPTPRRTPPDGGGDGAPAASGSQASAGTAYVSIAADEPASAWIEGKFAGSLPLVSRLSPAGALTVHLRREGGKSADFVLNLDPGQKLAVRWSFADGALSYE